MQSPRTKPRKSTVGTLYAVGGMDNNKGNTGYLFHYDLYFTFSIPENGEITFYFKIGGGKSKSVKKYCQNFGPHKNLLILKEKCNTVTEKILSFEFILCSKLL